MATINTSKLKSYAREACQQFITQVGARVDYLLKADSGALREREVLINELRKAVANHGRTTVVTEAAYRWFNRLVALRFMDVNDYADLRAVSPVGEETLPELLSRALAGTLPDDLAPEQRPQINDLLTGRLSSPDAQAEVYRLLLTAECHRRHAQLPFLFDAADGLDYDELLLPSDLLSDNSVLAQLRAGVTPEDCKNEEVIGWLYQFYISEKKDAVFAAKGKVKKEDIPAVTQLFTPRWIVEYMVQNTLGKLWLQSHPESTLRGHMPYYLESAEQEAVTSSATNGSHERSELFPAEPIKNQDSRIENRESILGPEDLTIADQACGSGHILLYAFDLLTRIYEESGYNTREIPGFILTKNLTGFEIDGRAAQLAAFTLMMRTRRYYRRALSQNLSPNIVRFRDLKIDGGRELPVILAEQGITASKELLHDLTLMQQATNFGSLIIPTASTEEIIRARTQVQSKLEESSDLFAANALQQLDVSLHQLTELSRKFWCVVDNPPYMGGGNMNKGLSDFVKKEYPNSKSDLFSSFMERGLRAVKETGYVGMITMQSWMFLSSYEKLRKLILEEHFLASLLQIGYNSFPELNSKVAQAATYVIQRASQNDRKGVYYNLNDVAQSADKRLTFEQKIKNKDNFHASQADFAKIPGSPVGYWVGGNILSAFESDNLADFAKPRIGLITGDSQRFLRYWFEVSLKKSNIGDGVADKKWIKYQKGGSLRKWYGNNEFLINWENEGFECINNNSTVSGRVKSHNYNGDFALKPGIVWTKITSAGPSFRLVSEGFMFDDAGPLCYVDKDQYKYKLLGLLSSSVGTYFCELLSPTLNLLPGHLSSIPVNKLEEIKDDFAFELTSSSKKDWDRSENSYDFKGLFPNRKASHSFKDVLKEHYSILAQQFISVHELEEKNNRCVLDLYQMSDIVTIDVALEDITILQSELDRKALAQLNDKLKRDPATGLVTNYDEIELPFKRDVIMQQFISYAVGCMLGRYSLDQEGLILANAGDTLREYAEKVGKGAAEWTFAPDEDGILPILQDDFFEDDIANRFEAFLRAAFGDEHFSENLHFVEECIGTDIRSYFVKDFYNDHVKRYKKRPIYWSFVSPGGHFKALVYLHRYQSDTVSRLLNEYLRDYVKKLEAARANAIVTKGDERISARIRTQADKDIQRYETALLDCREYATNILQPLAARKLELDLDDGVLVNYNKMGAAVEVIKNMNDAKGRKKVMGFDWVDFDWEV